ncbi:MAG: DUF11 domain-containing protein [Clostridia bacterium]|nr:DUF11 domain-containing protein [Clostridia bacterium]
MAVFTNRATLSYSGITTASNTVTGSLVGALSAQKTALADSYRTGGSITYVISLINSGDAAITGLTVTDDLGAGGAANAPLTYREGSCALFVNGVPASLPTVEAAARLEFTGLDLPAHSNALIIYTADVNEYAPLAAGSSITNTAAAQPAGSAVTASATVHAADAPALAIEKQICPATVMENGTLTYTFIITNTGAAEAGADEELFVEDAFSPVLSGLNVQLDGKALLSPSDYTYDAQTGEFATVPGAITVPAATFAQLADGAWAVTPGRVTLTVSGTV